jgi:hypothetical protein
VRSHLEGITGGQGDYLTGGVTVSALMPMRPIPFNVVYVLGLEEGRFPGARAESLLDLRSRKRRIGDITLAERNRYLFLEILISVRRKLYLSYVSRDLQKDRDLAPCSVVHQLRRLCGAAGSGGTTVQDQPDSHQGRQPGLHGTGGHQRLVGRDGQQQQCPTAQLLSPQRTVGCVCGPGDSPSELETALARYRPDFSLPDPSPGQPPGAVSLTIGLLRRFLLDPVEVVGRYHLGIGEQADPTAELAEVEDEPLSSQFPVDYEIRTTPVQ